ncbi:hypothetical protein CDCA_CDCA03G0873 [Cyanidium caldarium]|uniref:Structural maintenance of chromosomes protein n=1 Tax=Cyanidium caldarium TaxID=2771 RepID=A0AAV9IS19_CYACA|nr:hypothetical protein CDCA_CDCA03G0873 [Cyanidium caldarium]
MFIQSVVVSGFKSYRDETFVGPFSTGLNVVVGRNGSGKSSFFDAVRFVLSDSYAHLSAEQRAALLHEGAGGSALSAYVEIVLDNRDGRLALERPEVTIRRMVSLQKDEYLVDRRSMARAEVVNLLESAGFSRSNPYYIVQQGKIAALCSMRDAQRLELLREVAGTRTYDEKRAESLSTLEETRQKRDKIAEVLQHIEQRLMELEGEREELLAFQALDKERRAIELCLASHELDEVRGQLDELEQQRRQDASQMSSVHRDARQVDERLAAVQQERQRLAAELERLTQEHAKRDAERVAAVNRAAGMKVDMQELEQALEIDAIETRELESKLQEARAIVEAKRAERDRLRPAYEQLRQRESQLREALAASQHTALHLQAKQARAAQFGSRRERDTWLRREIEINERAQRASETQMERSRAEIGDLEAGIEQRAASRARAEAEQRRLDEQLSALDARIVDCKRRRNEAHSARQELWRRDAELEREITVLEGDSAQQERVLRSAVGNRFLQAYRVLEHASHRGVVYGPLYELFDVEDKFAVAVEVAGGAALNHIVVDTDDTAANLVQFLRERHAGRLTFVPLNRVAEAQARRPETPLPTTPDAVPLLSRLRLRDPAHRPVLERIFGRVMIARSVSVASRLAREHAVHCVTLDGDQVNPRGAMSGGYVDVQQSRLEAARAHRTLRERLQATRAQAEHARQQLLERDAQVSRLLGELHKLEAERRQAVAARQQATQQLQQLAAASSTAMESLRAAREREAALAQAAHDCALALAGLRAELAQELSAALTASEAQALRDAQHRIETLSGELEAAAAERAAVELRLAAVEGELESNWERRVREIDRRIAATNAPTEPSDPSAAATADLLLPSAPDEGASLAARTERLEALRLELEACTANVEALQASCARLAAAVSRAQARCRQLTDEETELRAREASLASQRQHMSKRLDTLLTRRSVLQQQKADAERKIRDLGALSTDTAIESLPEQPSPPQLRRRLRQLHQQLGRYAHVNKKALEQYTSFVEQRQALREREQELARGDVSIRELIDTLDRRRTQDLNRTFKAISRLFREVFAELVSGDGAEGQLVMLCSGGAATELEEENADGGRAVRRSRRHTTAAADPLSSVNVEDETSSISTAAAADPMDYIGVSVRVRFPGQSLVYTLPELSGGQRSIVALALVLAIQRLDPAPFLLFDEVDANLDAAYRERVAAALHRHAEQHGVQCIATTFRPEMIRRAQQCFGVRNLNKRSTLQAITVDEALQFVTPPPAVDDSPSAPDTPAPLSVSHLAHPLPPPLLSTAAAAATTTTTIT